MDLKELLSFLALWFRNFDKKVFPVKISNPTDTSRVEKKLGELLKEVSESSNRLSEVIKSISIPTPPTVIEVSNLPQLADVQKVEVINQAAPVEIPSTVAVSNLSEIRIPEVSIPPFPEIPPVKFPKVQEVTGTVAITNLPKPADNTDVVKEINKVIKGLQVVVDAITDLKLENAQLFTNFGVTYAGQTGSAKTLSLKEVAPTDTDKLNASYVYSYNGSGQCTRITMSAGGSTYVKDFTWVGSNCTNESNWS